jgi:hypothetical protein
VAVTWVVGRGAGQLFAGAVVQELVRSDTRFIRQCLACPVTMYVRRQPPRARCALSNASVQARLRCPCLRDSCSDNSLAAFEEFSNHSGALFRARQLRDLTPAWQSVLYPSAQALHGFDVFMWGRSKLVSEAVQAQIGSLVHPSAVKIMDLGM